MERGWQRSERRQAVRYPANTRVMRLVHHIQEVAIEDATLVNISQTGVLLETAHGLPVGSRIELDIPWPVRSGTALTITLRITGWVVRRERSHSAIRIDQYTFEVALDEAGRPSRQESQVKDRP